MTRTVIGAKIPSTINSRETLSIIIGIVALLLAAIITFLIIRSITQPLAKVAAAADRVAEGRVDVELDVHGRDEISKVADSFRAVIAHLKSMADVAREFAKGHLNAKIDARSPTVTCSVTPSSTCATRCSDALGEQSTTRQLQSGHGRAARHTAEPRAGTAVDERR